MHYVYTRNYKPRHATHTVIKIFSAIHDVKNSMHANGKYTFNLIYLIPLPYQLRKVRRCQISTGVGSALLHKAFWDHVTHKKTWHPAYLHIVRHMSPDVELQWPMKEVETNPSPSRSAARQTISMVNCDFLWQNYVLGLWCMLKISSGCRNDIILSWFYSALLWLHCVIRVLL